MERQDRSRGRPARLVGLAARRTRDGIATRWNERRLDEETKTERRNDYLIRSAEDVAQEFGQMKGAVMKLGQLLSYQIDALPEPARRSLATLRSDAPPMEAGLAAAVIHEELGAEPSELFAEWNADPVAAASIGQVHNAVLHDGTKVAVKVQYPGIASSIETDLRSARWLHRLVSSVAWRSLDIDALVAELRSRLLEEVDYGIEAERQQRFAERFSGHPFVAIPRVFHDYSTQRVLTTTWVGGEDFDAIRKRPDADRQWAAEAMVRFTNASVYRSREFHGDPHPGNFRFDFTTAAPTLIVLDFGLVKQFSASEQAALWPIIDAVLAQDKALVEQRVVDAGFLQPHHGLDIDHLWAYLSGPYVPFFGDHFRYSPSFTQQTLRRMTDPRGDYGDVINALSMPASFTILDRVVWGITAVLGQLGAANNWRGILLEYLDDAPPVTELGRQEAVWLEER